MKIAFIFGTRPEAIKLAPVIHAARAAEGISPHICLTGQHESMVAQVLEAFAIDPDSNLGLMQPNQSLASFSSRALAAIDDYLDTEAPDVVVVQGDTSTVLCASLAAFYRKIPVGHVEAGLRTGKKFSPFPEELNRVLASQIADYHFAPTENARKNLIAEGIAPETITVTGNTIVDALMLALNRVRNSPPIVNELPRDLMEEGSTKKVVLITCHRRENFGPDLEEICHAILALARQYEDVAFVYPVHLNPNVWKPVHRFLAGQDNVYLTEPLGYLPFVALMDRSTIILTDSGGIQEEAPSLGKPVLVMRDTTERPEGIAAGTAKLVGTNRMQIQQAVETLLNDESEYRTMANAVCPYGDGKASTRIVRTLSQHAEKMGRNRASRDSGPALEFAINALEMESSV